MKLKKCLKQKKQDIEPTPLTRSPGIENLAEHLKQQPKRQSFFYRKKINKNNKDKLCESGNGLKN